MHRWLKRWLTNWNKRRLNLLSCHVGNEVCCWFGPVNGSCEGFNVGRDVGCDDGEVGKDDGCVEGDSEGSIEGIIDG